MHYPVSITKKMLEDKIKYLNNQYELNLNIYHDAGYSIQIDGSVKISCPSSKAETFCQLEFLEHVLNTYELPFKVSIKL